MLPGQLMLLQLIMLAIPVGALGFFGWLALRFVRARERDTAGRIEGARPGELRELQESVASLQSEIHSLRERQEFMEKLLERPKSSSEQSDVSR